MMTQVGVYLHGAVITATDNEVSIKVGTADRVSMTLGPCNRISRHSVSRSNNPDKNVDSRHCNDGSLGQQTGQFTGWRWWREGGWGGGEEIEGLRLLNQPIP